MAKTEDAPELKSGDPVGHVGSTHTAATTVPTETGGIQMRPACEKLDCDEPAVAQARFGEVTVARACSDHAPDLETISKRWIKSKT